MVHISEFKLGLNEVRDKSIQMGNFFHSRLIHLSSKEVM